MVPTRIDSDQFACQASHHSQKKGIVRFLRLKFILLSLILSNLQAFALTYAQEITLSVRNASLKSVLDEIQKQSDCNILANESFFRIAKTVTVDLRNVSLSKALNEVFKNQPLAYSIENNIITLSHLKTNSNDRSAAQATAIGTVRGSGNAGLEGVTVREKGTNNVTSTNANGQFSLRLQSSTAVLQFRIIGYESREVAYRGTPLNVSLTSTDQNIDAVVVTGYQTIRKRSFTGASTTLKAEDIRRDGVADVSRMLEGQVAGVTVQNVSGTFGAAPKIRVRGATSITGENKPLWVVDGIVLEDVVNVSNEQLSTGDPSTLLGSAVAGINPDDIETFEILKDAAATSLYGARAMNGVVVITTKKGKAGKLITSYTGNFTTSLKPSYSSFDILDSYNQMKIFNEMEMKGWLTYTNVLQQSKIWRIWYDG